MEWFSYWTVSSTVNSFLNLSRSPCWNIYRSPSRQVHLPCRSYFLGPSVQTSSRSFDQTDLVSLTPLLILLLVPVTHLSSTRGDPGLSETRLKPKMKLTVPLDSPLCYTEYKTVERQCETDEWLLFEILVPLLPSYLPITEDPLHYNRIWSHQYYTHFHHSDSHLRLPPQSS